MTHATKAIYRWLLSDYIKVRLLINLFLISKIINVLLQVSNISTDAMLYTEADLEASMEKIEVLNFHEEKEVSGVRFWAYTAGHVLGAAMFMIEIARVKVLYTGDFSRQEDRHLMAAEIPTVRPDILITVRPINYLKLNSYIKYLLFLPVLGIYLRNSHSRKKGGKREPIYRIDP